MYDGTTNDFPERNTMDYDEGAFELQLRPNWAYEATSESYESLLVEVENLLHDAPNVAEFYSITDAQQDELIGFAVIFGDGTRDFYMASLRDTMHFSGEGELKAR